MTTPYVTPASLVLMPLGIGWNTIPYAGASPSEQLAEQTNICWRATHTAESMCNQSLRSDIALEEFIGPDFRMHIKGAGAGVGEVIASRWPVTQVLGGQYSPTNSFPPAWTPIPSNQFRIASPAVQTVTALTVPNVQAGMVAPESSGAGAMFIEFAPGLVTWFMGRDAWRLQVAYINGWPHTSLTEPALAGADTLSVDDVTGWTGAGGQIYDGANTEPILVTSVSAQTISIVDQEVPTGPGTITLQSPLANSHPAGVLVTALPYQIVWAAGLIAAAQALMRGASAVTAPAIPGSMTPSGGTASAEEMMIEAEALLAPYKRII